MPSGAKKRKAAKKKKEQEANNNSASTNSINPQGNDDPRSQDERESDSGEVASPVSQDHQHPFNKGNEESEKRGSSPVQSFVPENKHLQGVAGGGERSEKVGLEDDDVVKIERELNPKWNADSQDVAVEHVDSTKESLGGDDSSSSSSSSDNESQASDKKWKDEAYNSVLSAATVTQTPENEKPVREANSYSVVETVPVVDLVAPMSEMVKSVAVGAQVESSEVLDVVESGLKENEDKSLPTSNEVTGDSPVVVFPVKNEDKVIPISGENVGASSNVVVSTVNGNEGKTLTSSDNHTAETSNDAGNTKHSQTSECPEDQPLGASAPRVTQRTSWMSCCGLLDVFTGSN